MKCKADQPKTFPSFGRHLAVILTNRCNLNCKYCLRTKNNQDIKFAAFKKALQEAHTLGYRRIGLTGGEILLYPHLEKLLQFLGQKHWQVLFETNGMLFDQHWAEVLEHSVTGQRLSFSVSLDSHLASEHDQQRGRGSFQKALQAIKLIRRRFPQSNLRIIAVIASSNMNSREKIKKFLALGEKLGVQSVNFQKAVIVKANQGFQASGRQFALIHSIIRDYQGPLAVGAPWPRSNNNSRCHRLEESDLCLSPRGIHPCIFNDRLVLGNLSQFSQVFQRKLASFAAFREFALSSADFSSASGCDHCLNQVAKQTNFLQHASSK